jgi:hypothetical protein
MFALRGGESRHGASEGMLEQTIHDVHDCRFTRLRFFPVDISERSCDLFRRCGRRAAFVHSRAFPSIP